MFKFATRKTIILMSSIFYTIRKTLKDYTTGSNILLVATALALIIVNLPGCHDFYNGLWTHEIALQVGSFNLFSHNGHAMSIIDFVNDALMAIFFFSVGLEIKREMIVGELRSFRQALLPIIGACGGMIIPVCIYSIFAYGTDYQGGSAIPMATDIAFSLGVLTMLGNRVPISLKIFLTTLAVVDDIGGILVIAIFYSSDINLWMLLVAAGLLGLLALGGKMQIQSKMFYFGIGIIVWFLFLNAGIHPTIAGVLVALTVPARPLFDPRKYIDTIRRNVGHFAKEDDDKLDSHTILSPDQMSWLKEIESASDKVISPLQELEDSLHPLVNWIIIPLFAFANAGIYLGDVTFASMFEGVSLSIIGGLVLGKFIGIFTFSWAAIKLKLAPMPKMSNWKMMASVSMVGGIGFTVSLFIATLSFANPEHLSFLNPAKLGILVGSLIAGVLGYLMLRVTLPKEPVADID